MFVFSQLHFSKSGFFVYFVSLWYSASVYSSVIRDTYLPGEAF